MIKIHEKTLNLRVRVATIRFIFVFIFMSIISGCSSIITHTTSYDYISDYLKEDLSNVSRTYSGFCLSIGMIIKLDRENSESEILAAIGFYDMPFSIALDTLLLPIDLSMDAVFYIKNGYYQDLLCGRVK